MKTFMLFKRVLIASVLLCFCSFQSIWAQKTIVIGPSANADHPFSQFDSLLKEYMAGNLSGQITLALEDGTYTLSNPITIDASKLGNKEHLTITSVSGDRSKVTLTSKNGVVTFNNTKNVTFSNISLENTGPYSTINLAPVTATTAGGAENVTFFACNILATLTGTAGSNNAISFIDAKAVAKKIRNLHFINNNISGGCRNSIIGSDTLHLVGIRFEGNTISGSYGNCLNINNADSVYICNNRISIRNGNVDTWPTGLILTGCTVDSVCNNYIDMSTGAFKLTSQSGRAFSLDRCISTSGKHVLVANNVIIGVSSTGYKAGTGTGRVCYLLGSDVDFVFNSIYNTATAYKPTGAYTAGVFVLCVEESSSATKAPDFYIYGNQVITFDDKNQYPLLVNLTNGTLKGDYNNFYTAGKTIAYWNTQPTDLPTLQKDQPNSISTCLVTKSKTFHKT